MRKVTAHYVYCGNLPVKFGIVTLHNNAVVSVSPASDNLVEAASTEFYPGVLIPAIVNAASAANAWFPVNDIDVQRQLAGGTDGLPFAVVTPESMTNLSAAALSLIYHRGVKLALGSLGNSHPTVLFRLMVLLAEKLADVPFHQIVAMATSNGAQLMGLQQRGTIAVGFEPGIYHISNFCFAKKSIDQNSKIAVIID